MKLPLLAKALLLGVLPLSLAAAEEPTAAPTPPAYASFVCWDYPQLPSLRSWKETEKIIATTLAEGYPALEVRERLENGSPGQLKDFLKKLPDDPRQTTVVYLAAHQSPAGQWYFPDRSVHSWGSLMTDLPKLRASRRIVLLDCCYATSANLWPDWSQKIAPACIFASPENRPTPDLFVFRRRPVDWAFLFPKASSWLRQHPFNHPDERISFLGLVWLEAWLNQAHPPQNPGEWSDLAQAMTLIAQQTSSQVNSHACSEISATFPH